MEQSLARSGSKSDRWRGLYSWTTTTNASTRYWVTGIDTMVLDDGGYKYVYALGLAYAVDSLGNTLTQHTDGLGSVRAETDSSGNVVQTYGTDEFGIVDAALTSGTQPTPFQYTGEPRDSETGLVYLRARSYDPAVGRFMQADPLRKSAAGIGGWNRYSYVSSNPAALIDPYGLTQTRIDPEQFSGVPQVTPAAGLTAAGLPPLDPRRLLEVAILAVAGFIQKLHPAEENPSAAQLAQQVGYALSQPVQTLKSGYQVDVPLSRTRDIVIRIMEEGSAQNYYRVSIAGKQTYDVAGRVSSLPAETHIPISPESLKDVLNIVQQILRGEGGP